MGKKQPAMQPQFNQKLILLAFAALLLSVKADGRFPLPETLSETNFQLLLLPYTTFFVLSVFLFFLKNSDFLKIQKFSPLRLTCLLCICFECMILGILFYQEKKYAEFGYDLNPWIAVVTGCIAIILFLRLMIAGNHRQFLFTACGVFVSTYFISILSFPLHPGRSDMLPLIQAAGEKFLSGGIPYGLHSIPHQVPLTYLPGMWLAFMPAVALGFDVRFVNMIAVLSSIAVVYAVAREEQKTYITLFCGLFLMIPYLQYRHEIYMGILWLSLSLVLFFHIKKKPILACAFVAVSMSVSQFSWVLAPVLFISVLKEYGAKIAALGLGASAVVACSIVLPFWIQSPDSFYHGVFGHWEEGFNATTANLSYFTSRLLSLDSLKYVQIILLFLIYAIAIKNNHFPQKTYQIMTVSLLFFLLLNPLIWVYFYLTIFLLMLFDTVYSTRDSIVLSL